ncbi:MAG: restriction endonuclease subunit S [Flavisolibacter sp.]
MSGKYQAYAEYKDTGVEMMGCVPTHWNIRQVRFLLKDGAEGIKIGPFGSALKLEDMVEFGIRVYGQENVIQKDFSLGKRTISQNKFAEMRVYQIFANDLLITMMGTSGKCELVPDDIDVGIIDSHLLRLRVKESEILPRFFRLLIDECYEIENQIKISGKGSIMHGLNSSIVKALQLPLPSSDEQEKILAFLDHETAKIDTLIEKQQQLSQLLKEKRQAVISHAVTKGLNPNAPMRDSGVEWLGEVPEHWKVVPLKHLANIKYGIGEPPKYTEEGVALVRATNIRSGRISNINLVFVNPDDIPANRIVWLEAGDIIVVRSGAGTGDSSIIPKEYEGSIAGFDMVVKPIKCIPAFLGHALLSNYVRDNQMDLEKARAAQPHLNAEELGDCFILLPPKQEQVEIDQYIACELSKFDLLMQQVDKASVLLQERRTALISAAVTGKIDVRSWQAPEAFTTIQKTTRKKPHESVVGC